MGGNRADIQPQHCWRLAVRVLLIGLCLVGMVRFSLAAPLTPTQQAFSDAQTLAAGAQASAAANVTNGTVATTVNSFNPNYYSYSNTAPEASLFLGGNGDTSAAGVGKVTSCQTGPVNPDAFLQQNCDAINLMAKNPSVRPQFTINPSDPGIVASKAISANPSTLAANSLGFASPSAMVSFTGCTTTTKTTAPTFTTEVCNDVMNTTSPVCTVGRTITVDAKTNYQCDRTTNMYQTQMCNKTINPVVTPTQYCVVAGTANGIGSYSSTVAVRTWSVPLHKFYTVWSVVDVPYGMFNVQFGCVGTALASVTVSIAAGAQCHAGGCNSGYFPMTLNFIPGTNAGPITSVLAQNYTGIWWYSTTVSYVGATNMVNISIGTDNPIRKAVTASAAHTGTVGIKNVITSTLSNGCAAQEAAAR